MDALCSKVGAIGERRHRVIYYVSEARQIIKEADTTSEIFKLKVRYWENILCMAKIYRGMCELPMKPKMKVMLAKRCILFDTLKNLAVRH
jgi:hypothetical protein